MYIPTYTQISATELTTLYLQVPKVWNIKFSKPYSLLFNCTNLCALTFTSNKQYFY